MDSTLCETLREENIGGSIVHPELSLRNFYYLRPPSKLEHVLLRPDVIVIYDSNVLLTLCEFNDMSIGSRARWTSKKKEFGRLIACCNRSGFPNPSAGKGMRCRQSKRVNCMAGVRTKLLPPTSKLYAEIWRMAVDFHGFSPSDKPNFMPCSVTSINMQHSGHEVSPGEKESQVLLRSSTVMENPKLDPFF